MHCILFFDYLIQKHRQEMRAIARSARTAYNKHSFFGDVAMPAIIARDYAVNIMLSTLLAQMGE